MRTIQFPGKAPDLDLDRLLESENTEVSLMVETAARLVRAAVKLERGQPLRSDEFEMVEMIRASLAETQQPN